MSIGKYRDMTDRLLANSIVSQVHGLPGSPCWLWLGKRNSRGEYGHISLRINGKPRNRMAHRVSYETFIGPIPADCELDHRIDLGCAGSLCIHPNHTQPVTASENSKLRHSRRA